MILKGWAKSLALSVFEHQMLDFETLIKPYDSLLDVPFDDLATYAADDSNVTFQLAVTNYHYSY